jgi:hypothetical protein
LLRFVRDKVIEVIMSTTLARYLLVQDPRALWKIGGLYSIKVRVERKIGSKNFAGCASKSIMASGEEFIDSSIAGLTGLLRETFERNGVRGSLSRGRKNWILNSVWRR